MKTEPDPIGESRQASELDSVESLPEDLGHPRGTLAIMFLFGALFGLAWLAMYLIVFLGRGAPY